MAQTKEGLFSDRTRRRSASHEQRTCAHDVHTSPNFFFLFTQVLIVSFSFRADQRRLVDEEDKYRRLFAEEPDSRELDDPHLLLHDVFALEPNEWTLKEEDEGEVRSHSIY